MYGLAVNLTISLSGHLSNIDEIMIFYIKYIKISGFKNNIIHVQKEDFDAFEALDMDSATVTKAQSHKASKVDKIRYLNIFTNKIHTLEFRIQQ